MISDNTSMTAGLPSPGSQITKEDVQQMRNFLMNLDWKISAGEDATAEELHTWEDNHCIVMEYGLWGYDPEELYGRAAGICFLDPNHVLTHLQKAFDMTAQLIQEKRYEDFRTLAEIMIKTVLWSQGDASTDLDAILEAFIRVWPILHVDLDTWLQDAFFCTYITTNAKERPAVMTDFIKTVRNKFWDGFSLAKMYERYQDQLDGWEAFFPDFVLLFLHLGDSMSGMPIIWRQELMALDKTGDAFLPFVLEKPEYHTELFFSIIKKKAENHEERKALSLLNEYLSLKSYWISNKSEALRLAVHLAVELHHPAMAREYGADLFERDLTLDSLLIFLSVSQADSESREVLKCRILDYEAKVQREKYPLQNMMDLWTGQKIPFSTNPNRWAEGFKNTEQCHIVCSLLLLVQKQKTLKEDHLSLKAVAEETGINLSARTILNAAISWQKLADPRKEIRSQSLELLPRILDLWATNILDHKLSRYYPLLSACLKAWALTLNTPKHPDWGMDYLQQFHDNYPRLKTFQKQLKTYEEENVNYTETKVSVLL